MHDAKRSPYHQIYRNAKSLPKVYFRVLYIASDTLYLLRNIGMNTVKRFIGINRNYLLAFLHCQENLLSHPVALLAASFQSPLRQHEYKHWRFIDSRFYALSENSVFQLVVIQENFISNAAPASTV